jgi:two-component system phosphate regulon response regulator PhoB
MSGVILICEDEADLVATLEYALQREGFTTRAVLTGNGAVVEAQREPYPDLILLDLMLPDLPGTEVCRQIRRNPALSAVPVVMLTARTDEIDRVVGFEVGADDYVTKPFSVRELVLRIRAILRRREGGSPDRALAYGRLRVDNDAHRVWIDNVEIELTPLEHKLLNVFLTRQGRALRREVLLKDLWGAEHHVTVRTIDTHVKRLRQKLGAAGDYVETVRGVGYRFKSGAGESSA